ncbi:hypothetical protein B5M09_011973 [Aphanomyces astaci]|uniref:EF-hand domain-containing protein n=1 Tax=Aphanomyces astaci TaxID=112090 RepID=A0A425D7C2_APHAT|nr:hypothetical protein B5M09_011973 [Aphanomyces astaci]
MAASKAEYRLVKAKLRTACTKRRIRLEEFMKTFDVHKTKKITADQFTRAIDASGIRLSKPEVDLLIAKYRLPDDTRSVDYRRCCDLIDKPCTTKKADKLLKQPHNKMGVAPPSLGLQPVDAEALRSVKDKLATAIRTKGIVLKDVFHDFDKNNSGVVTKARFVRDLSAVVGGDLSLREVDAITKAYGSGPLDVHYKQLHADLQVFPSSSLDNDSNNDSPRPRRRVSNQGSGNDVDAVEAPLRTIVARDRIRMKNFFTDYDRLRAGKCTDGQFQRAVKVCFGALTEKDLSILVSAYSVPSEDPSHERKVDYVAFCKSVSSLVQDRDDANDELHVDVAPLPTAPCTRDTRGDLTDAEAASWTDIMTRLSHTVATRRILLKPLFCDFDRGKTECVSCEQFARVWIIHVLAMFNMFLTSADEKLAILKRYASTRLNSLPPSHLSFDNKAFVNFKTFCLDLDEFQRRDAAASTSSLLRQDFGSVSVRFGSPIHLKQFVATYKAAPPVDAKTGSTVSLVTDLAYSVTDAMIQRATCTPCHLVATILLMFRNGVSKYVHSRVSKREQYSNMIGLGYYRNKILHWFYKEGVVACTFHALSTNNNQGSAMASSGCNKDTLLQHALFLHELLAVEFVRKEYVDSRSELDGALTTLTQRRVFAVEG